MARVAMANIGSLIHKWILRLGAFVAIPFAVNRLGMLMNKLVITANGGVMPVDAIDATEDGLHVVWHTGMHFHCLCDYIHIGYYIWSPGDFLIIGGIYAAILGLGALVGSFALDCFPPLKGH